MSTVRTTFPENRFAKLARQPGGLSLTEALSRAQANLDSIRDESAAYVDARLGEIDAALGGDGSRVEDEALRRAYGLANDVVGVAGACAIGHGSSNAEAIANGILTTAKTVRANLNGLIADALADMAEARAKEAAEADAAADSPKEGAE